MQRIDINIYENALTTPDGEPNGARLLSWTTKDHCGEADDVGGCLADAGVNHFDDLHTYETGVFKILDNDGNEQTLEELEEEFAITPGA